VIKSPSASIIHVVDTTSPIVTLIQFTLCVSSHNTKDLILSNFKYTIREKNATVANTIRTTTKEEFFLLGAE